MKNQFSKEELLAFYKQMLVIRKFELAVQQQYKKGEIPGFIHLCIGQEAVSAGVCAQLLKTDWITSTHRGHGHALAKGVALKSVMAEIYGKATGCNGGRGGSMHLYSFQDGLFGTNGLVGGGIPLAVGLGMSARVRKEKGVAVSFFGDGAINHSAFHESMGLAAMNKAPVIFVCENNHYATCTPYAQTANNISIPQKAAAYGIPVTSVDGNDPLAVHMAAKEAIARARKGEGPTFIETITYRTVGHHEGDVISGTYRTLKEVEEWKERCPIVRFEKQILADKSITRAELDATGADIDQLIEDAVAFAKSSSYPDPSTIGHHCFMNPVNPPVALADAPAEVETVSQNWLTAVRDGIAEEMRLNEHILYMGEGIGERGGTFGHTRELWNEFGGERMIDTPICELAFTGAAAAASASGCRTIADLMFADFIFEAASQIINQASKLRYMSNGQISVPMVIRAGAGQIKQAGPQHSGTFHPVWAHIPGLIVVIPSTPADAKGLMKTALRSSDPVVFLEPKALLPVKGPVPVKEHFVPFGKARVVEEGEDITIVSFGLPVLACTLAAKQLKEEGISCEILDLRTIVPLDMDALLESVSKTRRLLVVEEAYETCSFSAEIIARLFDHGFDKLKVPAKRLNQVSVPQPFSPVLEAAVGITPEKVRNAVKAVMEDKPVVKPSVIESGVTKDTRPGTVASMATEVDAVKQQADGGARKSESDGRHKVVIPNIGLTITEVEITRWHKSVGDKVSKGEDLLDFESDKSVMSLEAEVSGVLTDIGAKEGATVNIGSVVGMINPDQD